MKTKRAKVAGESTMRQLLLMLLSMIVTFFILMANKSWILQQISPSSLPNEGRPSEMASQPSASGSTTNVAKRGKLYLFLIIQSVVTLADDFLCCS